LQQDAGLVILRQTLAKEKNVRFCEFYVMTEIFGSFGICQAHCQVGAFISKLSPISIISNALLGLYLNIGDMRNWYPQRIDVIAVEVL
jgi:hypothetical protein